MWRSVGESKGFIARLLKLSSAQFCDGDQEQRRNGFVLAVILVWGEVVENNKKIPKRDWGSAVRLWPIVVVVDFAFDARS